MNVFNEEQLSNLTKLADFLENEIKDEQFDLEVFRGGRGTFSNYSTGFSSKDDCGTIGCALGWMPFVVDVIDDDFPPKYGKVPSGLSFLKYCERVLGSMYSIYGEFCESGELLGYIFDDSRAEIDPDTNRMDAVQRIRNVIKANGMTDEIREDLDRLIGDLK